MARPVSGLETSASTNCSRSMADDQCEPPLYRWRWPNGFGARTVATTIVPTQQSAPTVRSLATARPRSPPAPSSIPPNWRSPCGSNIYLMTQDKKGVSAMKLHRHLGISYNAAWRISQADAGDHGARPRASAQRVAISSMTPISVASDLGAYRGRGAPGKALCRRRQTNEQGHPLSHEAHRRRGLSVSGNRRLGAAPPIQGTRAS